MCLGKLKCHHYICISCFSDVKFHSKCQICHKSFKKNDIKFEYLSPNSNWILPKSNFQNHFWKTAPDCGQKWIFEELIFCNFEGTHSRILPRKLNKLILIHFGFLILLTLNYYDTQAEWCNIGLTLIRESWTREKNPKRGTVSERAFQKKIWSAALHHLFLGICSCALDFFRKARSVMVPKNGIYFCSARHFSSHFGI